MTTVLKKSLIIIIAILFTLTSCATPYVVKKFNGDEETLSCAELKEELVQAHLYKRHAYDDAVFKPAYVLVIPAFISMQRMKQAESAAYQRIKYLEEIMFMKNCKEVE